MEVLGGLIFHHMTSRSEGKPSVNTNIGPFTQCHVYMYLHVHVCQPLGLSCKITSRKLTVQGPRA